MLTQWAGWRWSPFPVPMFTPEGLTGGVGKQNILAVIQWPGPGGFWEAVMSETPRFSCTSKWILVCSFFCPSDYYPAWSIFSICPGLSASIIYNPSLGVHQPTFLFSPIFSSFTGPLCSVSWWGTDVNLCTYFLRSLVPPQSVTPAPWHWVAPILDAPCGHLLNVFHGHDFLEPLFMLTVTG